MVKNLRLLYVRDTVRKLLVMVSTNGIIRSLVRTMRRKLHLLTPSFSLLLSGFNETKGLRWSKTVNFP